MGSIGVLVIILGLFYVVLGAPVFGTYNCDSVQFPINNNALLAQGGRYGIAVSSGNSYSILLQFNLTGNTLPGTVFSPYFTVYTGQNYALLDLSSSTVSIIDTAPALNTCPLTLPAIANEATRVVNVARSANGIIYRNTYLDQAAANLVNNQNPAINPIYSNDTAPGTTTSTFIAGTGSVPNPGSTVQSLFTSTIVNSVRQSREMGVYYDSNAGRLGYVFSSRNVACGNGVLDGSDQCDDSNTVSGDGCSSTCQIEAGYTCTQDAFNPISVCTRSSNVTQSVSRSPSIAPSSTSGSSASSTPTASRAIVGSSASNSGRAPSTSGNNPNTSNSNSASTTMSTSASRSVGSSGSSSPSVSGSNSVSRSVGAASESTSPSSNGLASLTTDPNLSSSPSSSNSGFVLAPTTTGSSSSLCSWMKVLF